MGLVQMGGVSAVGGVSTDVTFREVLLTAPQEGGDLSQS